MEGAGDLLLVGLGREGAQLLVLDVRQCHRAPAAQEAAQRHVADHLEARVDQEDVVEVLRQVGVRAQIVDGLADVPIVGHRDELALHQAPGAPLREGQALLDRLALGQRQGGQDLGLLGLVEIGQDLDRVVGLELGQHLAGGLRAQSLDHLVADELVEIGQRLGVEAGAQRPDDGEALLAGQPLQQVGEVGGVQRAGQAGDQVGVADGDRLADLGDQRVGELERRGGGFGRGHRLVSPLTFGRCGDEARGSRL